MSGYARVLSAVVKTGCRTSHEISIVTGLPRSHVSAYLSDLTKRGLVRPSGERVRYDHGGKYFNVWVKA